MNAQVLSAKGDVDAENTLPGIAGLRNGVGPGIPLVSPRARAAWLLVPPKPKELTPATSPLDNTIGSTKVAEAQGQQRTLRGAGFATPRATRAGWDRPLFSRRHPE